MSYNIKLDTPDTRQQRKKPREAVNNARSRESPCERPCLMTVFLENQARSRATTTGLTSKDDAYEYGGNSVNNDHEAYN